MATTNAEVYQLPNRGVIPLTFNEIRKIRALIPLNDNDVAKLGVPAVRYHNCSAYRVHPNNSEYYLLIWKIEARLRFFKR